MPINTTMNLPNLIAEIDKEDRTESERRMRADMDNTALCQRLGYAFLHGRLDCFLGQKDAFNSTAEPPYATRAENDLYAGGYQYDMLSIEHLSRHLSDLDRQEQQRRTAEGIKVIEQLRTLEKAELSLETVNGMSEARSRLQALTIANLIVRIQVLEAAMSLSGEELSEDLRRAAGLGNRNYDA